ncbi:MAG TPA: L-dopachrome tautomerase-related protein [Candidatus Acidoferrales bacterium]|nr:L-dopachrome tautomerase-related protein [Candidatus Acidoferrales bacterium]
MLRSISRLNELATRGHSAEHVPSDRPAGELELVYAFEKQMPVGFAFSRTGRLFVTYPRWEIPADFTLGEIADGVEQPYPDAQLPSLSDDVENHIISAQGIVIDAKDRLWVLDNASLDFAPAKAGGPKLLCFDLATNTICKKIVFDQNVVPETSFLNDLRVDLSRGAEGTIYITDSGEKSSNGLIVVDIATGRAIRRLANHRSVKAVDRYLGVVEGRPFQNHKRGQKPEPNKTGVDGIALEADGSKVYYCANADRRLYRVNADALRNTEISNSEVEFLVEDLGEKGVSDGLGEDAAGNIYTTNYEHNAILRRAPEGTFTTVVHDPRPSGPIRS